MRDDQDGQPYIPAGWYPDHTGDPLDRYWDGTAWTDRTRPATASPFEPPEETPTVSVEPTRAEATEEPEPGERAEPVTIEPGERASGEFAEAMEVPPGPTEPAPPPVGLPGHSTSPVPTAPPRKRTGRWVFAGVGVFLLVLGAAGAGFAFGRATAPVTLRAAGVVDTLTVGDSVRGRVEFGANTTYELEVDQEQRLTIDASSNQIDSHLTLLDDNGRVLSENDDFVECCDSRIVAELAPGSYRIVVRDLGNSQAGDIEVSVTAG